MPNKKKVNVKDLVDRIASLARERIAAGPVVSIEEFKGITAKKHLPTLLIIEDDDMMRRSLQRIFEADGHKVLVASDGTELSGVLSDAPIDLILLDVGLPWINGFELAQLMKEHRDLKNVPIVFISGHNDMAMIKKGFAVGAHDYITKPFDVLKVKKTIQTLLQLNQG